MRKYRHEIKYVIHSNVAKILQTQLNLVMKLDENSIEQDHTYKIRSLYFDTLSSEAYYEKLNGILYREKYRIRYYNNDDSFIRLERKVKHNMLTSKDQVSISREMCDKIIDGEIEALEGTGLLGEFLRDMKIRNLKPSVIVDYKRLAYTYPVSNVRITFDYKIQSGRYHYDLFEEDLPMIEISEQDEVVLEVKYNEFLPEVISTIISTVPMYRKAVSKFAICRSVK